MHSFFLLTLLGTHIDTASKDISEDGSYCFRSHKNNLLQPVLQKSAISKILAFFSLDFIVQNVLLPDALLILLFLVLHSCYTWFLAHSFPALWDVPFLLVVDILKKVPFAPSVHNAYISVKVKPVLFSSYLLLLSLSINIMKMGRKNNKNEKVQHHTEGVFIALYLRKADLWESFPICIIT